MEDSLGNLAFLVKLSGQGRVRVFRDGVMVEGSWVRQAPDQLLRLQDAIGRGIALKPGQRWVEIVPPDANVTMQ